MSESERGLPPEDETTTSTDVANSDDEATEVVIAGESVDSPESAPARRGWPGIVALLALLIVVAGWIAGGLIWQRLDAGLTELQLADARGGADTAARMEAVTANIASLEQEMAASNADRERERALFEEGLRGLRAQITRDEDNWVHAEIEYLLLIASRRMLLAGDLAGADFALAAADERLRQLADPDLLPVREQIADERNALRAVPDVDIDGLALSLRSLARRADLLPSGGNRYRPGMEPSQADTDGRDTSSWGAVVQGLWSEIKGLVQVRRDDRAVEPLPTVEQERFLYLNLRIQFDAARLALLRGSQGLYNESLQSAREWIEMHFDRGNNATRAMLEEIGRLQSAEIAPELPDLSGSLRMLRAELTGGAGS